MNTLGAVLGGELADDARRYLAGASADARRLLGTVDDLLALAHLRAPELRHMEAVPVEAVARARASSASRRRRATAA